MRKRKGKDVPFWEFDFALCWLDAGLFLTLWKWLFTHVLVSLYSLSQMLNAVPQYRMIFKLLLSNLHVTKIPHCNVVVVIWYCNLNNVSNHWQIQLRVW